MKYNLSIVTAALETLLLRPLFFLKRVRKRVKRKIRLQKALNSLKIMKKLYISLRNCCLHLWANMLHSYIVYVLLFGRLAGEAVKWHSFLNCHMICRYIRQPLMRTENEN